MYKYDLSRKNYSRRVNITLPIVSEGSMSTRGYYEHQMREV
jgi:hypothetical protein